MRARVGGGLTLFAFVAVSVVACTFIVDGETKDLTGTCTPTGANDTACGKCAVQHCQAAITENCASGLSSLETCIQNPLPGTMWRCEELMGDAAVHATGLSVAEKDLRFCMADACADPCVECGIDAGTGQCGTCIMQNCGTLLNGNNGCCDDVSSDIRDCTDPQIPNCHTIRNSADADMPDAGWSTTSCEVARFAQCVVQHCDSQCPP